MKKFFRLLSFSAISLLLLASCAQQKTVPYTALNRYFFKTNADPSLLANPVVSKSQFDMFFGSASVMGANGLPTQIDFDKQFVIAVVKNESNNATVLTPISLTKDGQLIFKYSLHEGDTQSFTTRPMLLIAVDKKYEGSVKLVEQLVK